MGRPSTETASDEKAISNPGYNDLNDDTYGNDNDVDNGVANDKLKKELAMMENNDKGFGAKIVGGVRSLWGTRLTEAVEEDKDLYVRTTLRELVLYVIFLVNLCVMSLGMTSSTHFYYTNVLQSLFLDASASSGVTFRDMQQMSEFWDYVEEPLMAGLYWEKYYNGEPINETEAGYIFYENKLLGVPRIRQLKVRNDSCTVHRDFADDIKECFANYDPNNEEKRTFGPVKTHQFKTDVTSWNWTEIPDTPSVKSVVLRQGPKYPNTGYYQDLKRTKAESVDVIKELKQHLWIDRGTRAILIDFTVYNANINLFCVIQLLIELPATGGVYTASQFKTVKLLHLKDSYDYFILGTEIVYMLFILYYTIEEILEIKAMKMKYFKTSLWNWVDLERVLIVIILSYLAAAFQVYRYLTITEKLDELTANDKIYPEFGYLADWQRIYNFTIAFIVFFAWLKLFKYISFNTTMNQLSETLSRSAKDLGGFMIMFSIVFLAYTQLGFLIFGAEVKDFSEFHKCFFTLFRIILGDFNFHQLEDAHRVLGPTFFISYVFFVFFVLLNMFLAIINDTYSEVKADLSTQESEFDLGAFLKKGYSNMLSKMNLKKDRLKDIQDALQSADSNNDNVVDWEEWRKNMKDRGIPDSEIEAVFAKYDLDGDMVLNTEERRKLEEDLFKQTERINKDIEDVKDRQESGEALGLGLAPGPEGEISPMSNDLLLEKLNKMFVTSDEFNILGKRVERMEQAVANIVRKIDSIVDKIDQMDRHKARQDNARDKLFNELGQKNGSRRH